MSVKRRLEKDKIYQILEFSETHPQQAQLVGYRIRMTMQLADDAYPRHFLSVEGVMQSGPLSGRSLLLFGVRLLRTYEKIVCNCRAYSFPHHSGKGACFARFEGPFCGECGQPAEIHFVRLHPAEDVNNPNRDGVVSACCAATLFNDPSLTKEYTP